ncbi:HdeD family acid-resistance protein [Demequina mangrovi]|uniref:Uncharacterized membrane protein HdeD, DUF308 family n=1 Tax=Demequina mangrovi TaxID=1043493 RepID=A0A1H6Y6E7_9MICO|nr:DUF308 domain-containing protein [Demequina mangrovi]SEJ36868.1 Uncharacterized membrane protein HdeD, DUF308 family [Demequina mangrovi]
MPDARQLGLELDARALTARAITAVRVMFAVLGVVALAVGVAMLVWPGRTLAVGAALAGIYFVIAGVARIAMGVLGASISGGLRGLSIVMGVLMLVAGMVMLRNLAASTTVLLVIVALTVGVGWIIDGIMVILESGKARSRGWAVAYGAIGVLAGIAVIAFPTMTATVMIWIAAAVFVVLGIMGLVRAFTFGRGIEAEL